MSEQTLQIVAAIRERLRATVRRITLAELAFGAVLTLGVLSALWLLSVALEAGFWLDTTPRAIIFWCSIAVAVAVITYFLLLPLLRLSGVLLGPSEEVVAQRIGGRFPDVDDRLVNLLHLVEGRRSESPDALLDGAVRMLGESVRTVPFERVEEFERARKAGRLASVPLVGLLVFLIVAPATFLAATQRLFSPGTLFERPAPFQLDVAPGSVELVKGASLTIVARPHGSAWPRSMTLELQHLDEDHTEEVRLTNDSTDTFRHTVVNVRRDLRYRINAGPVVSPWYTAAVVERPLVRSLQVALRFPVYTRIPPQRLDPNVGDVTALPGTEVTLDVQVGGVGVREAFIQFDDGTQDTLILDGTAATGSFRLMREGSYQIQLRNDQQVENSDPITYTLKLLSDAPPSIVIARPGPETELSDAMQVDLQLRINDDFGFSRLQLFYRLAESRFSEPMASFKSLPLPLDDPSLLDQEILFDWLVAQQTGLDLVPGDVVEYFVQVRDNDAVAGYKSTQSPVQRLRLPSLAEQYRQLDEDQAEVEGEMEHLLQESDEIQEQFQELRNELRQKQQADWEDERQLEQIQERQRQLDQRVEDLSRQIDTVAEQMEENHLISDETLQMYEELKKVVEEIQSPELQEALQQLQEALKDLNLQMMQKALGDFEFNEDQYRQRLERSLELFKRLQTQQRLEEAARRAEELAKQQEHLAEETKKLRDQEAEKGPGDKPDDEAEKAPNTEQEAAEQEDPLNDAAAQDSTARQDDAANRDDAAREDDRAEQEGQDKTEGEQQENQQGENQQGTEQQDEQQQQAPGDEQNQQSGQDQPQQREQLARDQERARQEMEALQEQLQQLLEQMQEMQNSPSQQMQQLNQALQQQQLPQQMQQNAEQLRQQQLDQAQQGQQQMQQQLQQLQQQLQQMQQNMQGTQMQMNLGGLRRALDDVLTLSQQQEDLRASVNDVTGDTPQLREYARRQTELAEDLSVVSDSLQHLAKDIPQMRREVQQQAGEALREMGDATDAMAERITNRASGHQKASMMHLNELALLLSDLMNQLMNSQGGQGGMSMQQMLQQLQDMAGQQQKLNDQIQKMLNDSHGDRLSSDMQERLSQMAAEQAAIQRQLKQLNRNPEARGKLLGDLNKIADQMEDTIQELQRQNVNPRTVERQREILTRLLDAQKSIRERGKDRRRESREGRDLDRESPGALTPSEQAEKLRRDLIRALESGYAPDYEELIKRYFELLQEQSRDE